MERDDAQERTSSSGDKWKPWCHIDAEDGSERSPEQARVILKLLPGSLLTLTFLKL